MSTDRLSHRERMLDIASGWQSSNQTQQAYCEANNIQLCTLGYWLRRHRELQKEAHPPATGFVPLSMLGGIEQLEIHHPNGVVIKAPVGAPTNILRTLLTPA